MTGKRRGQVAGPPSNEKPQNEPTRFLIARAMEVEESRKKRFGVEFRFKIQHIMWLSVWTALVLAVRGPLLATLPEIAAAITVASLVATFAMFIAVFGIALLMEEGLTKDRVVLLLFYGMAASSFLFLSLSYFAVAVLK